MRYPVPRLAPGAAHTAELLVRRSRFIAAIGHSPSIETARAFIQARKKNHADATHNCWAFCAGPPGDTARIACGDDGEPRGTAGRPMLTALLHGGVGDLACVVTRYFGGVKLGTAGLAHAYRDAVQAALEKLPVCPRAAYLPLVVNAEYSCVERVRRILTACEAEIKREEFTAGVRFFILLPEERLDDFSRSLAEQGGDRAWLEHDARPAG